jgi:hypothetical protein
MKGIIEREKRKLVRQNTAQLGSGAPSRADTPMRIEEETVEHEEMSDSETASLLNNGNKSSKTGDCQSTLLLPPSPAPLCSIRKANLRLPAISSSSRWIHPFHLPEEPLDLSLLLSLSLCHKMT